MPKDSFIIYTSFYEPIKNLSDKQLGRLFRALFSYQKSDEVQVDSDINMAFSFFKNQMDIDRAKYQKIIERNKQNGSKGGRRSNDEKPSGSDRNPKNPVGFLGTQAKPNDNDNVNDNDINTEPPKTDIIKMDNYGKRKVDDLLKSYITPEYQAVREAICFKNRVTMDQVTSRAKEFTMHLKSTGKLQTTMRDFMTHFSNWMNTKPISEPVQAEPKRKTSEELLKKMGY